MSMFFLELENRDGLCYSKLSAEAKTLQIFIVRKAYPGQARTKQAIIALTAENCFC